MTKVVQRSFAGGELTPKLHRRSDLAKYGSGLALCRNAIVHPQGPVSNRAGMMLDSETKYGDASRSLLYPFRYSASQAYALEFGDGYIRVHSGGALVLYPSTPVNVINAQKTNPALVTVDADMFLAPDEIRISGVGGMTELNGNDYEIANYSKLQLGILDITQANPAVVTVEHVVGLATGDAVTISGVYGMTDPNGLSFIAANRVSKSFAVTGVTLGSPNTVVGLTGHNYSAGDRVVLRNLNGAHELNGLVVTIGSVVAGVSITFPLDSSAFSSWISGGTVDQFTFQLTGFDSTLLTAYAGGGFATRRRFELVGVNATGYGTFASNGSAQYSPAYSGSPVEIESPYGEQDIDRLGYTQSADVMTITRHGFTPRELRRYGHHLWRITNVSTGPSVNPPALVNATGGTVGLENRTYQVTAMDPNTGEESLPRSGSRLLVKETDKSTITWTPVPGVRRYFIYKKVDNGGSFGFIGVADDNTVFDDPRITPVYGESPPSLVTPFSLNDNPGAVAYYKQRIVFANFESSGLSKFVTSQVGNFKNFNKSLTIQADESISGMLAGAEAQEILHMIPMEDLIIFTASGEWIITGDNDGVFTPNSANSNQIGNSGCSIVRPILAGETILFVQARGNSIRDLGFKQEIEGYQGNDLAILAEHLFRNRSVVSWSFSQVPDSIVWCVLDDGTFLSLTYQREHQVWGWGKHYTQGQVESVVSIPEGPEDRVYFIVRRKIGGVWKRFVERMAIRQISDVQNSIFVDCSLSLDNPLTVTAATATNPVVITSPAHGLTDGDPVDLSDFVTGMEDLNGRRAIVTNKTTDTFEAYDEGGSPIDGTAFVPYDEGGKVRKAYSTIAGLGHLEGKEVDGLANGDRIGPMIVTGGAITLPRASSRVHVGLAYITQIKTLEPDLSQVRGVGDTRRVGLVRLLVEDTRGGWAGSYPSGLIEIKPTPTFANPAPLITGRSEVVVDPNWDYEGQVLIEQRDPLPFTLCGVEAILDAGDY